MMEIASTTIKGEFKIEGVTFQYVIDTSPHFSAGVAASAETNVTITAVSGATASTLNLLRRKARRAFREGA